MTFLESLSWKVSVPLVIVAALLAFILVQIVVRATLMAIRQGCEATMWVIGCGADRLGESMGFLIEMAIRKTAEGFGRMWQPLENRIWVNRVGRRRDEAGFDYNEAFAGKFETDPYDEAIKVLGLVEGFNRADLDRHYKRLMMSVHPDKGGNDWLGSRINASKDIICQRKGWRK